MGVEPTPSTFGDYCPRCFDTDETPETLIMFSSGIEVGNLWNPGDPNPPNGKCYLTPTVIECEWTGGNATVFRVFLNWTVTDSRLTLEVRRDFFAFVHSPSDLCTRYFINARTNPTNFTYVNGYAVIMTPSEIVAAIEKVVPYFNDGARFEVYPGPGGIIDIRYANKKHRQNITIQFDSAEL